MVCLGFPTTNNKAKYKALMAGLDLAKVASPTSVIIYYDSQVVTSQVNGDYEGKGEWMEKYLEQVRKRVGDELQAEFVQIPREENEQSDHLAKAASVKHMLISSKVLFCVQLSPMIDDIVVQEIGSDDNQTTLIVSYLRDNTLPDGKEATKKLKVQAARFILVRGILYKRGFS